MTKGAETMEKDYFMRQIQMIGLGIAKVTGLSEVVHEVTDPYQDVQSNDLYKFLMKMLADGKINEAENLLFDMIERRLINKQDALNLALDFYLKVNSYNDEYLELCDFSRIEADVGWADITKLCEI